MKASYLLLLLIISSSIEYQYEYVDNESIEEQEPILGFNFWGLIAWFIKQRIHSLKDPNFWIQKLGNMARRQLEKMSENKGSAFINAIRDCDERLNKDYKDQVIAIRKEVGLPLDIRDFCENNPGCGTKIKNDYDYLDVMIFKIPPLSASSNENYPSGPIHPALARPRHRFLAEKNFDYQKYHATRAKVDKMYQILNTMDQNFDSCLKYPSWAGLSDPSPGVFRRTP